MPISQLVRSAVSGMMGHKLNLDVIANNLANVNTVGYKASRVNFQDAMYQATRLATSNRDLRLGAGVKAVDIQPSFTQGALQQTGQSTDLAIYGDGFFQVQQQDGTIAYTRNGNFHVDAQGRLVTSDGLAVVPNVVVPPDGMSSLTTSADGQVRVERYDPATGQTNSVPIGQIQVATFINPEGLQAIGQSDYVPTQNSGGPQVGLPNTPGFGQIVDQALENSNTSMPDEMTNLVSAQRAYGLSVKALQTIDEMLSLANNMRSGR